MNIKETKKDYLFYANKSNMCIFAMLQDYINNNALSFRQAANLIGISRQTISKMSKGNYKITEVVRNKIIKFLREQ